MTPICVISLHQKSEMISIFDLLRQTKNNKKSNDASTSRGAYFISSALTEKEKGHNKNKKENNKINKYKQLNKNIKL